MVVGVVAVGATSIASRSGRPQRPDGVRVTAKAPTTVSLSWKRFHGGDVTGVEVFVDARRRGFVRGERFTVGGLVCEHRYRVTLRSRDRHGERSGRLRIAVRTAACPGPGGNPGDAPELSAAATAPPPPAPVPVTAAPAPQDLKAPTTPRSLALGTATLTAIPLSWKAASDKVGVAGYSLFLDGARVPQPQTATSFVFTGLACGTSHTLAVQAYDAAGNVSQVASRTGQTLACPVAAPAPAPAGGCPSNPLQGVQNAGQLTVLDAANPCRTATGRIASTSVAHDGDCHVDVTVDAGSQGLRNAIDPPGQLVTEVIPNHSIPIPSVGSQVSLVGTWVHDDATGWNELHPVWSFQVVSGGTGAC